MNYSNELICYKLHNTTYEYYEEEKDIPRKRAQLLPHKSRQICVCKTV